MWRLISLLLSAFCAALVVLYMATETTTTQAANNSLSLNGSSGYVSVPSSATINISGPITLEAWIKVNAINGSYQDIVCRESWGQAGTGGGYEFAITNSGKLRLDLYQSHNQYTTVVGATTITTGQWHHVAGVFDGSQMRVYYNGVLDGSLSTTNGPAAGTSALNIGKSTYAGYYFGGLIDEVRISGAALYSANFSPGLGPANNTRGFWKFDGQTATDQSGNNNHGTLQGGSSDSTNVPAPSNNAPTINLTDPLHNTAFAAGSTVMIDAVASDNDGFVARVDFFQGTTLLGSDASGPYSFAWNNVPGGLYSVTAKAVDDDSAVTTSTAVTINVIDSSALHSLSLNGTSGYVSVPNSATINISGPITIEAWIKVNAINGSYQDIVCRESWGQAGTGGGYEFAITNTGKLRLDLYQSHNQYTTVVGASTVTTGQWHHVAGVFDGSQMRVYYNGVLDGSLSTTNGPATGTSALNIGKSTYAGYYFGGLIDEVRISAAALYSANFSPGLGPANNTRGFWKFDGQTATDQSGNNNHGTLQGGASYSSVVPQQGGGQRPLPVANGPYNAQIGQTVQLSSSGSSDPGGSIVTYRWNFGDGTVANSANPTHSYAAPGLYTATLTVTDNSGLLASATAAVTISGGSDARLDPANEVGGSGENALSRNFNWTLPLVSLPGRAGFDLNLILSYNSLVWSKNGNYISFDDDNGFPGPGFRLGFPVLQPLYYNSEVGKYAFLLVGPDGSRTELRQVGSSTLYEAADSSHLLLDAGTMTLRTAEGTQLSYQLIAYEYQCTQVKDRNGNYLSINYTPFGRIDTVTDTLDRRIKFNYDASGWLTSITQAWNQGTPAAVTHEWATFTYGNTAIQTNFGSLSVVGPSGGTTIKTLSRVTFANNSHYDFSYTSFGQVWKISYTAGNELLHYRAYNLPQTASTLQHDCPRFTERRDWARHWNGDTDGTAAAGEEAVTSYAEPVSATWTMPGGAQQSGKRAQVTLPDGTSNKIYFVGTAGTSSGWSRGLPALVETYEGSTLRRQVVTTYTQDNTSVGYQLNSRVLETNVYDPAGNRARIQIAYQQFTFANGTSCHLPRDVYEYAADASTIIRSSRTLYNTSTSYTDRRILGLVSEEQLYEGNVNSGGVLMSKVGFAYDESGSVQGTDAPVQHDNTAYGPTFVVGRGNLSSVKRYDVSNTSQFTTTSSKFNTAGAVVLSRDASNHDTQISYSDSFSDNNNSRNTLAYPTTITDADLYTATTKYNFDLGVVTRRQTPQPNTTQNLPGPEQAFAYDQHGRLLQVTNLVNNAYTRFEYASNQTRVDVYSTIQEGLGEAHSFKISDGAGRVIATAADHPGSVGGFSGQKLVYDVLGRVIKTSNPAETSASGSPSQWTTAGDDASTGWLYTQQTYDWKSRPLVRTNPDGTTKSASYTGCGCAGGEVVTLVDEGTVVAGVTKKRQQRTYADALGRKVKIETMNWGGESVFSTTVNTYNARDQLLEMKQFAGAQGSPTFQTTTISYDGYSRIRAKHTPEQDANASTTWTYNADDTVSVITDPRGATSTFSYNARGLVETATYVLSGSPTINLSYNYDAARNRTSMNDPSGSTSYSYNLLSQLTAETRAFTGLSGQSFTIAYAYNLGGDLKSITLPTQFGTSISYQHDRVGRLNGVTSTGLRYSDTTNTLQYLPTLVSNISYRAWNGLKALDDGQGAHIQLNYGARLSPSAYSISNLQNGASMSWEYQYHPDGTVKFASDLTDNRFDRKYEYDQAARLVEAYTGNEARGGTAAPTPDSPYRLTSYFDVFGNLERQTGRIWQKNLSGDTFNYSNNRRQGLTYDAAGRVVADLQGLHVFDAQGQRSRATAGTVGGGETGNPELSAEERQTVYNGEGHPAIVTLTTRGEEPIGPGPQTNISTASAVIFYLRSTILDAVVAELDSQGLRFKEYFYAGGQRLAEWSKTSTNERIEWQHKNPATGAWVSVSAGPNSAIRTEVDPGGRITGNEPFFIPPEPTEPSPTRDTTYFLEGGATIEAELGMQLYEAQYINKVFGDSAGPGNGPYSGERWRQYKLEQEFELMIGNRFLFGIDKVNANVPGSYEWVDRWEQQDDGSTWVDGPDGPTVNILPPVNRGYFRTVPGASQTSSQRAQSPNGSPLKVATTDDLNALLKKFYQQYQKKLARCIWSVFATDRNGQLSNVAEIMAPQTLKNAPVNNIVLGYSSAQIGGYGRTDGKTGTIYIATDLRGVPLNNGRQVSAEEQFFRTYAHELGNHLSWLYTENPAAFGIKGGIRGQAVAFGISTGETDEDTGARLEECIWGDVSF